MKIEINTDRTNVEFPIIIKDKRGNVIYNQNEYGDWYESTYNEKGKELTFKTSDGYYSIKRKKVTKEEFEVFVNGTPEYTMEELVAKLGHNFKIKN
jgi:hypothetical protein